VTVRVVGIDLSLTSTGLAFVEADETGPVEVLTEHVSSPTSPRLVDRHHRLLDLTHQVLQFAYPRHPHLCLIEGPSFSSKGAHTWDRAGLWWMVVSALLESGNVVLEVTPSTRMKYATGSGRADKDKVVIAATRRYADVEFIGNDEADALVIAAIGARLLGAPIETKPLPKANLAAMTVVEKAWGVPADA
jgi:crossover junction endodeoxyribonuclease RuvC